MALRLTASRHTLQQIFSKCKATRWPATRSPAELGGVECRVPKTKFATFLGKGKKDFFYKNYLDTFKENL